MGAIAGLDDLTLRLTGGGSNSAPENIFFFKSPRVAGAAAPATVVGKMTSLWLYSGIPGEGVTPTTVVAPTNATAGSLQQTDPAGGTEKWLLGLNCYSLFPGTLILYDRLLHIGGLSGTVITAQTVGGSLTRYTNGIGNQIWVEVYGLIGVTSRTITASYSNTTPTSGRTTQAAVIGNTNFKEAQRILPLSLNAADVGVSAVASVTLSASTGTAGNFGVNIVHPLAMVPIAGTSVGGERNHVATFPAPIKIQAGACLALAWVPFGVIGGYLLGNIITVCA